MTVFTESNRLPAEPLVVRDKGPYHSQDEVTDMTAPPLPESALARFIPSNEALKPGPGGGPCRASMTPTAWAATTPSMARTRTTATSGCSQRRAIPEPGRKARLMLLPGSSALSQPVAVDAGIQTN